MLMTYLIPITIGIIASLIAWLLPSEGIRPKIKMERYIQKRVIQNGIEQKDDLRRSIHISNNSNKCIAYNLICYFEFLDENNKPVYFETRSVPYVKSASTDDIIQLRGLDANEIKAKNVVDARITVIYENRYGTKLIAGPVQTGQISVEKETYSLK